ncbi:MAG TPA: hypothetical protein VFV99_30175 [Kofleriaceae bacterium]|nr:hypothetical protein [Kofleriaceae bacterium]
MRVYKPMIVDGEQRFVANVIAIAKGLIAFGELLPERGMAPKFGTPIHSLLIHLGDDQVLFELNDQGNTRYASNVERVELTPTTLRIVFVAGQGPYSGRVSLSPRIEVFDRDTHQPQKLRSVLVEMKPTATQLARIRQRLGDHKLIRRTSASASASVARKKSAPKASGARHRVQRSKRRPTR